MMTQNTTKKTKSNEPKLTISDVVDNCLGGMLYLLGVMVLITLLGGLFHFTYLLLKLL